MDELKRYQKTRILRTTTTPWRDAVEYLIRYRWFIAGALLFVVMAITVLEGIQAERKSRARTYSFELSQIMGEITRLNEQGVTVPTSAYDPLLKRLDELYARSRGTPIYPLVLIQLYHVHIKQRNFDAALGVSQELREVSRGNPRLLAVALYQLGKTYEFLGDNNTAIVFYRQAQEVQGSPFGEYLNEEIKRLEQPALPQEVVAAFMQVTPPTLAKEPTRVVTGKIEIPIKEILEKMEK